MKRGLLVLLALIFVMYKASWAQTTPDPSHPKELAATECGNGIDDDKDGFIDCFDSDCISAKACVDSYIGNDPACKGDSSVSNKFTMELDWESPEGVTNHLNRVSIGDLDHTDGTPEVVSANVVNNSLYILNGNDGQVKVGPKAIPSGYALERDVVIADIDADGKVEIFAYGQETKKRADGTRPWRIFCYDYQLTLKWITPNGSEMASNPYYLSIADFGGDGRPEIYYKNEIVDAATGIKMVQSPSAAIFGSMAASVAVDMDNDDQLDLVVGLLIYKVSLDVNRTLNSGSLTLMQSDYHYKIRTDQTSTVSIADYDLDGSLDVLATGSYDKNANTDITQNQNQNTTVFFWNVKTGVLKTYIDKFNTVVNVYDCAKGVPGAVSSGSFYSAGWRNGTGRINIADLDGDGKLNAVYVSGKYLYALKEDFTQLWRIVVNEETSGYTGCTMFDFNGDGKTEIVYRDERYVYIVYGDGTVSNQQKCISRTNREYPIVADVDGKGATKICVTCASDDNLSDTDFCNQGSVGQQQKSVVRVFRSATEPWVPARRLWNQHGYFNVNVNNDLTIPKIQQKHHLYFSENVCTFGKNRPLNSFLNQSPYLDSKGCPKRPLPDIAFADDSIYIPKLPTCPEKQFAVKIFITNKGNAVVSGDLPITFYKNHPLATNGVRLNTEIIKVTDFLNDTLEVTLTVQGDGGKFNLYVVLNDAGTSNPPIKLPNTSFIECDYDNFAHVEVDPGKIKPTVIATDNFQCTDLGTPPTGLANGSVSASIKDALGNDLTNDFFYYWSIGSTSKPVPGDYTGKTYTNLAAGAYTVYAKHKTINCDSDTAKAVVKQNTQTRPIITVSVVHDNDNCVTPNGELKVTVAGGAPIGNYTYDWYDPNAVLHTTLSTTNNLTGIKGIAGKLYAVDVVDKATGCISTDTKKVNNVYPHPRLSPSQTDILCDNLNKGSVTLALQDGSATANYRFSWFTGTKVKPTANPTGIGLNTIGSLPAGPITVFAEHLASNCNSDTITVTIKQTTPPVLIGKTVLSNMSSCDAVNAPNGAATINVVPASATRTYTFNWFKGQNTVTPVPAPGTISSTVTTSTATKLVVGIYTIKVMDDSTKCFTTDTTNIKFRVVTPVLSAAMGNGLTNCRTPNGSVTITSLTPDATTDYYYHWFKGLNLKSKPDFTDTLSSTLSGVPVGIYTVQAIHKTKKCYSNSDSAKVIDQSPKFRVELAEKPDYPTDCNNLGGFKAVVVPLSGASSSTGYDLTLYNGFFPTPIADSIPALHPSSFRIEIFKKLVAGMYNVKAVNRDNGCVSNDTIGLPFQSAPKLFLNNITHVADCNGKGDLQVRLQNEIAALDESYYRIEVRKGFTATDPLVAPSPYFGIVGQTLYPNPVVPNVLDSGYYYISAIVDHVPDDSFKGLLGCGSSPILAHIDYNATDPVIDEIATNASKLVNTFCGTPGPGMTGSGSITVSTTTGVGTDFNYTWSTATNAAMATTQAVTGLAPGDYTVLVTKNASPNKDCFTQRTFTIYDNPKLVTVDIANGGLKVTDVFNCDATGTIHADDGSAEFTEIKEEERGTIISILPPPAPAPNFSNYTFTWTKADGTNQPDDAAPVWDRGNLAPGDYFVKASDGISNCDVSASFTIKDKSRNTVFVQLDSFQLPKICFQPSSSNKLGRLIVSASGSSANPADYLYTWTKAGGPLTPPEQTSGAQGEKAIQLVDGDYTVKVVNATNNCSITDTYRLHYDTAVIRMVGSSSPVTFCNVVPGLNDAISDGVIYASVISVDTITAQIDENLANYYTYSWTDPNGNALSPNQQSYNHMAGGLYTVTAIDKNPLAPAVCRATITVQLDSAIVFPNVTAFSTVPASNCDLTRPNNGIATAIIDDDSVTFFSFDWYDGFSNATNIGTGPQVTGLSPDPSFYTVKATKNLTQCTDTTSVTILFNPLQIPSPIVELISNDISCISPNGALSAYVNVNGVPTIVGYRFVWTDANGGTLPDNTASIIENLPGSTAGITYIVTATDSVSGCSNSANGVIVKDPVMPKLQLLISDASCDEQKKDGFVSAFIMNTEQIQIDSMYWTDSNGNVIAQGPILAEINSGDYKVHVLTDQGCPLDMDVHVNPEIFAYNGISRNGDDKNPTFWIDCIDTYENNNVKIFNRAGTLVYEADHYDNSQVFFEGRSNKGVSVMGTDLPDGTYFYIIDKRNGSKRIAGYIEIVN